AGSAAAGVWPGAPSGQGRSAVGGRGQVVPKWSARPRASGVGAARHVTGWAGVGPVRVASGGLQARYLTPTSFTLVVQAPGYVVSRGSSNTFRTLTDARGRVLLQQTGRLYEDDAWTRLADQLFGPVAWAEMANRLHAALYTARR